MIQLKQGKKWVLSKKVSTEHRENCVLNCFTYSFDVLGFVEHLLHLLMFFYLIFLGVWWLIRFIPQTLRDGREHASSRAQCNGIRSQSHHHRHSKIYQFKGWISHDISMPEKPSLKTHVQDAHAVELPVWDQCIQVMCFFFRVKRFVCLGVLTPDIKKVLHISLGVNGWPRAGWPGKKILRRRAKAHKLRQPETAGSWENHLQFPRSRSLRFFGESCWTSD